MPIAGTGPVLAAARKAAKDSVSATWRAKDRVLSDAEIDQMKLEIEEADSAAIVAHIVASATLVVPGVGLAAPPGGGPVTGVATGTVT